MMKMQAGKRGMGMTCLAIGGIFLFNPVVAVVDVLPNIFGYLLIYVGLWRLSDLNDEFASAFRLSRTMLLVSVLELAFWWVCYRYLPDVVQDPNIDASPNEVPMAILLCAVVTAILNFCFLIPMFKYLFAGFGNAAIRCDGCAVAEEKRELALWESLIRKSTRFTVLTSVLAILPELTVLTSIGLLLPKPTATFDWYRFAPLLRGVAGAVAALIGLLWLISYLRFFVRVQRDAPFCASLRERYEAEILPQVNWLLYRRYSVAFFLATVGLIFSAHLNIDNRSILPGFVCAILLGCSVAVIGARQLHGSAVFYTAGAALVVISGAHEYFRAEYVKNYSPEDALHLPRAYEEFYQVRLLECAEAIVTSVFVILFLLMLWQIINRLSRQKDGGLFTKNRKKYAIRLCLAGLFDVGAAIFGSVNAFLQLEIKYLWWIALLFSTILLFVCRNLLVEIREEILSRAESDRMHKIKQNETY